MEVTAAVGIISRHVSDPEGLMYKLHRGKGLDRDGYAQLVRALQRIADDWKGRTEIPKNVAALVYSIDKSFESSSYQCRDAEGDLVRRCSMEITSILVDMFEG